MLAIFKQLHGAWIFERTIVNYLSAACSGAVKGVAKFAHINEDAYLFTEHGEFVTANDAIAVQNEYIYKFDSAEQTIIVYSSQQQNIVNKLFSLRFTAQKNKLLSATCEHHCATDHYAAEYIIAPFDEEWFLQIIMSVRGPNKNYQAVSKFYPAI